jgi:hypothetical protein
MSLSVVGVFLPRPPSKIASVVVLTVAVEVAHFVMRRRARAKKGFGYQPVNLNSFAATGCGRQADRRIQVFV